MSNLLKLNKHHYKILLFSKYNIIQSNIYNKLKYCCITINTRKKNLVLWLLLLLSKNLLKVFITFYFYY